MGTVAAGAGAAPPCAVGTIASITSREQKGNGFVYVYTCSDGTEKRASASKLGSKRNKDMISAYDKCHPRERKETKNKRQAVNPERNQRLSDFKNNHIAQQV